MTLHPQIDSILRQTGPLSVEAADTDHGFSLRYQQWSASLPAWPASTVRFGDFNISTRAGHKLPARIFMPTEAAQPQPMLFVPGGHGASVGQETHHELCRFACEEMQRALILLALPAETGWSTALACVQDCLRMVDANRQALSLAPHGLFIGGDGTGALLAWQAARQLALAADPVTVDAALLISPYAKPDLNTPSHLRFGESPTLSRRLVGRVWNHLLGPAWSSWRPDLIPFHAPPDTLGLVRTAIAAAECDPLHDDALHLNDLIESNGGQALFRGAPTMPHDFVRLAGGSAQAMTFLQQILQEFKAWSEPAA